MPIRLFAPRYWLTWLGLALLWLFALLPYRWLIRLGRLLGLLLRQLPIGFIRTARRNIELCLPELDAAEREVLLAHHFESLGIGLFEIAFTWWSSLSRWLPLIQLEGREHLEAALARGRGVILLTAHFTTLEVGGRILLSAAPVSFLYRPAKNEVLAHFLKHRRCKYGGQPIPRDDIRTLITSLRNNEVVWYAPDQSYRKKGAQMVPLFGIPAATNTFTSRLARMTGAAVLPYFFERLPQAHGYRAVIYPPLEHFPSECPVEDAQRFNRLIEAQVRKVPEQYLWIHRRFKGLSSDYPDYYSAKRPAGSA
ncbi:MAG TPA: LpxL/LpxP family Kdo(2)-lipid IV(A) lauroyl/palmitoleoyl acyltransferase [Steroidobacteraceae bacterium]